MLHSTYPAKQCNFEVKGSLLGTLGVVRFYVGENFSYLRKHNVRNRDGNSRDSDSKIVPYSNDCCHHHNSDESCNCGKELLLESIPRSFIEILEANVSDIERTTRRKCLLCVQKRLTCQRIAFGSSLSFAFKRCFPRNSTGRPLIMRYEFHFSLSFFIFLG